MIIVSAKMESLESAQVDEAIAFAKGKFGVEALKTKLFEPFCTAVMSSSVSLLAMASRYALQCCC